MITSTEFAFKRGFYKYYAPKLYNLHRLKARFDLWRWGGSSIDTEVLTQHYWDRFLSNKFEQELQSRGHRLYSLPIFSGIEPQELYILGCGASINQVTEGQWHEISKNYSIGLNNFYVHPFVANEYFCEFANNREFLNLIYEFLLNDESKKKSKVNLAGRYILFKGEGYETPIVQKPYFYVNRSLNLTSKPLLLKFLKKYYWSKCKFITHHISNLDSVINYAVKCGYKNIYLVGVDLTGDDYFWDHSNTEVYVKAQSFIRSFQRQNSYQKDKLGRHATASNCVAEKLSKLTIVEYLDLLQHEILSVMGVQLWVTNPNSLLADVLPVKVIPHVKIQ